MGYVVAYAIAYVVGCSVLTDVWRWHMACALMVPSFASFNCTIESLSHSYSLTLTFIIHQKNCFRLIFASTLACPLCDLISLRFSAERKIEAKVKLHRKLPANCQRLYGLGQMWPRGDWRLTSHHSGMCAWGHQVPAVALSLN